MIDFGLLPPEVNSARLFAGAGPGPLLAAAAGWDVLATSLFEAAQGFGSAVAGLATVWTGHAAQSMSQVGLHYQSWLTTTALAAEQTAARARASAAAFEAAFAATVPPAVVAANRALLAQLVATNLLGQNTAAIMATEAQYLEIWAQDAAAMYGYQRQIAQTLTGSAVFTDPLAQLSSWGQAAISSAPYDLPFNVLSLLTGLWTGSTLANVGRQEPTIPEMTVSPTVPIETGMVRAATGIGRPVGLLRVPPTWTQPSAVRALQPQIPLAVAEDTLATPMPTPMPLGMALGQERKRADPEFGKRQTVMQRHPYGG